MANNDWGVVGSFRSYVRWFFSSLANSRFIGTNRELILVTGSDSSHFQSQLVFLESARRFEPGATVIVWDLGFTDEEIDTLRSRFPEVHYRRFPYEQYPDYFNVKHARGEYAWKPVAVKSSADEFADKNSQAILVWCDAGNVLFKRQRWLRRYTVKNQVFAPFSRGTLEEWTHPDTLKYFGFNAEQIQRSNCCSCLAAFDLRRDISWSILNSWAELALAKDVFAPEGSSRGLGNETKHRQDQSVLSCLLVAANLLSDGSFRTNWTEEYLTHQDVEKTGIAGQKPPSLMSRLVKRLSLGAPHTPS